MIKVGMFEGHLKHKKNSRKVSFKKYSENV